MEYLIEAGLRLPLRAAHGLVSLATFTVRGARGVVGELPAAVAALADVSSCHVTRPCVSKAQV